MIVSFSPVLPNTRLGISAPAALPSGASVNDRPAAADVDRKVLRLILPPPDAGAPTPSDLLRNLVALPVHPAEHVIRLGVSLATVSRRVELQRPSQPARDVREVHQRRRDSALLDRGRQIRRLPAPHRLDEVRPVPALPRPRWPRRLLPADVAVVFAMVFVPHREISVG